MGRSEENRVTPTAPKALFVPPRALSEYLVFFLCPT